MAEAIDELTEHLEFLISSLIISRSDVVPQAREVVRILGRTPHAVRIAVRILATKIKSSKEQEALHALELVDLWMRECGPHFQAEVGKFQFLNELIKLLHPQYSFARTPPVVRQRVLIFLYKWTKDYSHETRILQAYELLKKLGFASKEDPVFSRQRREVATAATSRKRSIFEDETKSWLLQSLLQSKNPEDHQTANRLIKFMVKEDERREELNARRRIEIDSVRNNAILLCEMLDSYHPGRTSAEELKIIKNVHRFCEHIHPLVIRFASEVQNNDKMLGEVLNANDLLAEALNKYALVMEQGMLVNSPSKSDSLLDLSTPSEEKLSSAPATGLPDQLQGLDLGRTRSSLAGTAQQSSLEVLGDIFGSLAENESSAAAASVAASSDHAEPTILQPVSLLLSTGEMGAAAIGPEKEQKPKGLTELDRLGEIMLKDNLPPSHTHQSSFSRPTLKIPMNLLGKSQSASSGESSSEASAPMNLRDLEEQVQRIEIDPGKIHKRPQTSNKSEKISDGDSKEDISERSMEPPFAISESLSASASSEHQSTVLDSEQNALCSGGSDHYSKRALADVFVSLDSIKAGSIPPLSLWDKNGLSVVLHFAKDAPRPDVSVIVVTTVNGSTKPITSFLFQAAVPKTCRLRLLPPSGTDLPAQRHFLLPPSVITQVMLIANPKKDPVSLKYMISYTLDGEMTTEVGEVETLPMGLCHIFGTVCQRSIQN